MMRHRHFFVLFAVACLGIALVAANEAQAVGVAYNGGTYTENFDGLPTDMPSNANIQGGGTAYVNGWQDDTTTVAGDHVSVPGWYLWHPLAPTTGTPPENGTNDHQRLRVGPGANTGAFWAFGGTSTDTDKALGSVGATTVAGDGALMSTILRLVNNTGSPISSFTVTYDGEEWRDGQSSTGETLQFSYNVGGTPTGTPPTITGAAFTNVPALNFTSPVVSGTGTSGTSVDGNTAGKIADITGNIFLSTPWAPGADLWLKWSDPQLASAADDGLAIDNVRFTAPSTGPPPDINSAQSGNASAGSTWVGGNPPSAGFTYHVLLGHTVDVDAPFAGTVLKTDSGGTINIAQSGNGASIPNMVISVGGALTETVSGDFVLGDLSASNTLQLDANVTFTVDPGPASPTCDLCLNTKLSGAGNIDINSAPGTSVSIPRAAGLTGTITFSGTGDVVKVDGNEAVNKLVMNSTGMNKVAWIGGDVTSLTFNQPGIIDHVTTTASRLQGGGLAANAQVTINETTGYPDNTTQTEERRFQTTSLTGNGNLTVNGTAADYTNAAGTVTLNEFEVGTTGEPTGNVSNSTYSGIITANDYLNMEIRHNTPRAGFVVNNHARLEFGFQVAHPAATKSLSTGQITVNNGGTLEVGFEQGPVASSPFYPTSATAGVGNHVAHLDITSAKGRSGGLTLTSGATLRMQINGLNADQFDSISATGNVNLGGATLDLLANAVSTDTNPLDAYFPADGDTFTLISIIPAPVQGDYNNNGSVGQEDYDVWKAAFGNATGLQAADGDNNGVVDGGDYAVWRKHLGQSSSITGSISGDININKIDPFTSWAGFTIEKIITPTSFQLKFHAAGSGASLSANVPEPSTLALGTLLFAFVAATRRGRIGREN